MNTLFLYQAQQIYQTIKKEKYNMVLEPLQAMIQLALLSVTPIGTKLTIDKNILYIQTPSITQPITRWYNSDKKDDLFFLFQVIRRFLKWYSEIIIPKNFRDLLINMASNGLDNLIKTYQTSDNPAIIQAIMMYKNILVNSTIVDSEKDNNIDDIFQHIINNYDINLINVIHNTLKIIKDETDIIIINDYIYGLNLIMKKHNHNNHRWIMDNLVI